MRQGVAGMVMSTIMGLFSYPQPLYFSPRKEIWEFEMALIPHSFVARFIPVLDQFAHIHLPEGVGFARLPRWSVLPWKE
jgi:hypothetical protein